MSIENVGPGAGEQFKAALLMIERPDAVAFMTNEKHQIFVMAQGEDRIAFYRPQDMRTLGQEILEMADQWEQGKINGLDAWKS